MLACKWLSPVANTVTRCTSSPFSKRCTSSSNCAVAGSNSSSNSKVPPHGKPKRWASSAVMPYFTCCGGPEGIWERSADAVPLEVDVSLLPTRAAFAYAFVNRSIRSSSIHPPDTDPTTLPLSHKAMMEPTGRGDEPQVRTTVANNARWPDLRQSRKLRNTMTSKLSMN